MTATAAANPRRPVGHEIVKSVLATAAIGCLLVIWPIAMIARYREISTSTLDFQLRPEDPLLIVLSLLGVCVIIAILGSFRPLRRYSVLGPMQTAFRDVVAMSLIGHGPLFGWTASNPDAVLSGLEFPDPEQADDQSAATASSKGLAEAHVVARTPIPDVVAVVVETVPHTVRHRDSWWKIAEELLDDAQRWSEVRDLNLGTEVASGVTLDDEMALRSGWTIVVPTE